MKLICRALLAALLAAPHHSALALDPDQVERWAEDIAFYRETLPARHIDLYHTVSRERFEGELDRLLAELPSLSEARVIFHLMRITRLINDGHTQFPIMAGPHAHYPLRFRLFGDEVRVIAAADPYRAYIGARVVAIAGQPTARVLELLSPVVQGVENPFSLKSSLAFHLTVDDMLYAAGITGRRGAADFTFQHDAGEPASVTLTAVPMEAFAESTRPRPQPGSRFGEPSIRHSDGLWLKTDPDSATALLYFSTYPPFEDMLAFAEQVRERLERLSIRNIVIDLRDNGGGDFYTGLALSQPLLMTGSINWREGVYVLIGRDTFSAAMSNAAQYRQILNATLVGEPTGANPVGYQELGSFRLPNSNRAVFYSQRRYRFQETATPGIQPDVLIETDAEAYFSGSDRALEWVMQDIERRQ